MENLKIKKTMWYDILRKVERRNKLWGKITSK